MATIGATPYTLTTISGGINRLRTKGGTDRNSLYDLLNGYVTQSNTIKVRPGTFRLANIAAYAGAGTTKGLVAYQGVLHTFSSQIVTLPPNGVLHVLAHPSQSNGVNIPLKEIHFAAPYLGGLYVVAEFTVSPTIQATVGSVFHYWIQFAEGGPNANEWQASTDYSVGDVVIPTVPNGLTYVASRLFPAEPLWAPNTQEMVGNIVEPTVPNGFGYVCVATTGTNPATGTTEPTWPTADGAQITENNVAETVSTVVSTANDSPTPQTPGRYDGLYGPPGGNK